MVFGHCRLTHLDTLGRARRPCVLDQTSELPRALVLLACENRNKLNTWVEPWNAGIGESRPSSKALLEGSFS